MSQQIVINEGRTKHSISDLFSQTPLSSSLNQTLQYIYASSVFSNHGAGYKPLSEWTAIQVKGDDLNELIAGLFFRGADADFLQELCELSPINLTLASVHSVVMSHLSTGSNFTLSPPTSHWLSLRPIMALTEQEYRDSLPKALIIEALTIAFYDTDPLEKSQMASMCLGKTLKKETLDALKENLRLLAKNGASREVRNEAARVLDKLGENPDSKLILSLIYEVYKGVEKVDLSKMALLVDNTPKTITISSNTPFEIVSKKPLTRVYVDRNPDDEERLKANRKTDQDLVNLVLGSTERFICATAITKNPAFEKASPAMRTLILKNIKEDGTLDLKILSKAVINCFLLRHPKTKISSPDKAEISLGTLNLGFGNFPVSLEVETKDMQKVSESVEPYKLMFLGIFWEHIAKASHIYSTPEEDDIFSLLEIHRVSLTRQELKDLIDECSYYLGASEGLLYALGSLLKSPEIDASCIVEMFFKFLKGDIPQLTEVASCEKWGLRMPLQKEQIQRAKALKPLTDILFSLVREGLPCAILTDDLEGDAALGGLKLDIERLQRTRNRVVANACTKVLDSIQHEQKVSKKSIIRLIQNLIFDYDTGLKVEPLTSVIRSTSSKTILIPNFTKWGLLLSDGRKRDLLSGETTRLGLCRGDNFIVNGTAIQIFDNQRENESLREPSFRQAMKNFDPKAAELIFLFANSEITLGLMTLFQNPANKDTQLFLKKLSYNLITHPLFDDKEKSSFIQISLNEKGDPIVTFKMFKKIAKIEETPLHFLSITGIWNVKENYGEITFETTTPQA